MENEKSFSHIPVMLDAVIDALQLTVGGVYADGTLGGGGHSEQILQRIGDSGKVYGIDRDTQAIEAATKRLGFYPGFKAIHGNFHNIKTLLQGIELNGGLLDLGVSSYQLDTPQRGFSYHENALLDMRMDTSQGMTASQWLMQTDERSIAQALYDYADERWGARIAKIIVELREESPFETTADLVRAVDKAIPKAIRQKDSGHPARRTFQAVRIAVNNELNPLAQSLEDWAEMLVAGGRLCVISFHSIEDRIVKKTFNTLRNPCICHPKAPICTCGLKPTAKVLFGGAVKPDSLEIQHNSRARSAILRVIEKL
ncbi:MAG: 16S rRNA (cytosine(1402)-N(4))-methyltransferase RsmH [Clostridiales bacterium]|nr:16S rRNA (cytosine(1402)-N(4))-methyltransferase RsmH [Clostridiales bacterium]